MDLEIAKFTLFAVITLVVTYKSFNLKAKKITKPFKEV